MNITFFHGYRIHSCDLNLIETVLLSAQKNVYQTALKEYHRLLSEEVAELIDDIAMNLHARPDRSLLSVSADRLNRKIMDAENYNTGTEYDLRATVQIIPHDDGFSYLIFHSANAALEKAFAVTAEIENYTFDLALGDGERAKKWEALRTLHDASPSISVSLTRQIKLDCSRIHMVDKSVRAATRARRHLTTLLLNRYACGKEIENSRLMPTMDKALSLLLQEENQDELQRITAELSGILPNYDLAFIQAESPAETQPIGKQ